MVSYTDVNMYESVVTHIEQLYLDKNLNCFNGLTVIVVIFSIKVNNFLLSVQLENVIIHKSLKPTNKTYQMPRKRIFGDFEKKNEKKHFK